MTPQKNPPFYCKYCLDSLDPNDARPDYRQFVRCQSCSFEQVYYHTTCVKLINRCVVCSRISFSTITIPAIQIKPPHNPAKVELTPRNSRVFSTSDAATMRWFRFAIVTSIVLIFIFGGGYLGSLIWRACSINQYYQAAIKHLTAQEWIETRQSLEGVYQFEKPYMDSEILWLESYYQPAKQAFDKGLWETTRYGIKELLNLNSNYRDAAILLKESYYQPGKISLENHEWDSARKDLIELLILDLQYKDAYILLRESYYIPGTEYLSDSNLEAAANELEQLSKIDGNYKDTKDLLKQIFLRPVKTELEKQNWEKARALIQRFLLQYPNDDEGRTLLLETFFQPGKLAFDRKDWPLARLYLSPLTKLDPTYNNVSNLLKETYYIPAVEALNAGQCTVASDLLGQVAILDPTYKNISILEKDSIGSCIALLWKKADTNLSSMDLNAHNMRVRVVTFSPNNDLLAAASEDKTVSVWDPKTGQLKKVLKGHDAEVMDIAFSPDGTLLASASKDSTICLWSIPDGNLIRTLKDRDNKSDSLGVRFSLDGRLLASGGKDSKIFIWNVQDNFRVAQILTGHMIGRINGVYGLAFSPDKTMLVSTAEDSTIRFWSMANWSIQKQTFTDGTAKSLEFSADGKTLAVARGQAGLNLMDSNTLELKKSIGLDKKKISWVSFFPDASIIAAVNSDDSVYLWNTTTGDLLRDLKMPRASCVVFSSDGVYLAVGKSNGIITIWKPKQ